MNDRAAQLRKDDPSWAESERARLEAWRDEIGPEGQRDARRRGFDKVRIQVIEAYGGKCACCDTDYLPHLTLDHVHGGGSAHRKVEDSRSLYRRLRREGYPRGEFQVLCWNCNLAKFYLGACGCRGVQLEAVV